MLDSMARAESTPTVISIFLTAPTSFILGWESMGCWIDSVNSRTILGSYLAGGTNTAESCLSFCASGGYTYAGMEYGTECFCSNSILAGTTAQDPADCNMACSGDISEVYGGNNNRLSLYQSTSTSSASPGIAPGSSGYAYLGCYTDSVGARILTISMPTDGGSNALTAGKCLAACAAASYKYAGVEYSGECFSGGSDAMTVDACVAACAANGFTIAGLEYAQEGWCGTTLTEAPLSDAEINCFMPCKDAAHRSNSAHVTLRRRADYNVAIVAGSLSQTINTIVPGSNYDITVSYKLISYPNSAPGSYMQWITSPDGVYFVANVDTSPTSPAWTSWQIVKVATFTTFSNTINFEIHFYPVYLVGDFELLVDDIVFTPSSNQDVLQNSGFENSPTDIAPWYGQASNPLTVQSTYPFTGNRGAGLTHNYSAAATPDAPVSIAQDITGLVAGASYTFSFVYYTSAGTDIVSSSCTINWAWTFPQGASVTGRVAPYVWVNTEPRWTTRKWTAIAVTGESATVSLSLVRTGTEGMRYLWLDNIYAVEN
ncbi:WSC-domain-containing protein [Mytilinidion resinicola]|uniref:WSC-domain-containing protein n=1 Tax=Mytilinidion resinicola TaxID=574789 RepID=A0A6A6YRR0_9PEZI|nr:WSC-domain-containing protein [Mytilinidion resinicola]KAF2811626.1 WSC-domain-containing protein [Mytilinidion resinicola]